MREGLKEVFKVGRASETVESVTEAAGREFEEPQRKEGVLQAVGKTSETAGRASESQLKRASESQLGESRS